MDNLIVDLKDLPRRQQDMREVCVSAQELLDALSEFDPYGIWCIDIDAGLMYWSEDTFRIHELQAFDGPVNLLAAIKAYHPADQKHVLRALEEAAEKKSGFRFVLRVRRNKGGYKLVKCTGKYRQQSNGAAEIVGTFSQFQSAERALAVYG